MTDVEMPLRRAWIEQWLARDPDELLGYAVLAVFSVVPFIG